MAYDGKCGSCYWLRDMKDDDYLFKGSDDEKGHCIEMGICPYPTESKCSRYENKEEYSSQLYPVLRRENDSTVCYITTIVCELLGFDDDCKGLETLRNFRDNIMQKDPKYAQLLYQYDTVGPKIADCLKSQFKKENDEEPDEMIVDLNNFYIQPTIWLVEQKNYDAAVNRYTELTTMLMDYYGIQELPEIDPNYDYTQGGHGVVKKIGQRGE